MIILSILFYIFLFLLAICGVLCFIFLIKEFVLYLISFIIELVMEIFNI